MKNLFDVVQESLFDDENIAGAVDRIEIQAVYDFLKKYTNVPESKFQYILRPKARKFDLRLDGDKIGPRIIIKKFEEYEWPTNVVFHRVKDITVCIADCPNVKNLGNIFSGIEFENASLEISGCRNLESLAGCPDKIDGSFVLMQLPKLTNISEMPADITGLVSMRKLGTRIKKANIKQYLITNPTIIAEEEEEVEDDEMVEEAFADGRLSLIWDWVKKTKAGIKDSYARDRIPKDFKTFMQYMVGHDVFYNTALDELSSNIIDVRISSMTKDQHKLLNSILNARSGSAQGIIVVQKGKDIQGIIGTSYRRGGRRSSSEEYYIMNAESGLFCPGWRYGSDMGEIEDVLKRYFPDADHLMVFVVSKGDVQLVSTEMTNAVADKRLQRRKSQEGVITPGDAAQYKAIALKNIQRYKDIIAKMKFTKNADMTPLNNRVQEVFQKLFKMTVDIQMGKLKIDSYKYESLVRSVNGQYQSEFRRGKITVLQEDGVMELWKKCTNSAADLQKTSETGVDPRYPYGDYGLGADYHRKNFETAKKRLEDKLVKVENNFKQYGY